MVGCGQMRVDLGTLDGFLSVRPSPPSVHPWVGRVVGAVHLQEVTAGRLCCELS
jgi:hypothetical protein